MIWVPVDIALAVLAVLFLAGVGLLLFRAVKALMRRVTAVSALVAGAADSLAVHPVAPTTGAPVLTVPRRPGRPRR